MQAIYKYSLERKEFNVIRLPINAQVLSVESQGSTIYVWGLVDKEETETVEFEFRTFGTGYTINPNINDYKFLGTVNLDNSSMFHIFYKQLMPSEHEQIKPPSLLHLFK